MTKRLLGYQIADLRGNNVQGEGEDPSNLASFEVMTADVANGVMEGLGGRRFLLMPIYEGDVEEPTIVG